MGSGAGRRLAELEQEDTRREEMAQQQNAVDAVPGLGELGSYNDGHDWQKSKLFGWKAGAIVIVGLGLGFGGYALSQSSSATHSQSAPPISASDHSTSTLANVPAPIQLRSIGTKYLAAPGCPTVNEFVYDFAIANGGPSHAGQIATFQISGTVNETVRTPVDATGRVEIRVVNPCKPGENLTDTPRPISIGNYKFASAPPPP